VTSVTDTKHIGVATVANPRLSSYLKGRSPLRNDVITNILEGIGNGINAYYTQHKRRFLFGPDSVLIQVADETKPTPLLFDLNTVMDFTLPGKPTVEALKLGPTELKSFALLILVMKMPRLTEATDLKKSPGAQSTAISLSPKLLAILTKLMGGYGYDTVVALINDLKTMTPDEMAA